MAMYQTLRSQGKLSYDRVETAFEEHQAKWPEAIFNEDSYFKYLAPMEETGTELYLPMLQGSKAEQRKWWLYNRFRYMDSKYNAGDSLTDFITIRGYAKDDITITPYADVYASVKYGSYLVQTRAARNQEYTLECPLDNVNDTEIYIYSASQLKDVGDLSGLKPGLADFSMATKLQALKIGDSDASYSNGNLTNLTLGNNVLLKTIDVRNCPNLVQAVDVSGCVNVEEIYFDGTGITGLNLPNGGILKKLHLPGTVTNLTIRNQGGITEFVLPSYDNITTLRLENVSSVIDSRAILEDIAANSRVRLIGFDWEAEDAEEIGELYDILDTMRGLDENGNNMPNAQVSGRISVPSLKTAELTELTARYPGITIAYEHIDPLVTFYNGSTLLGSMYVTYGTNAVYSGSTPTKASTDEYDYAFSGWTTVDGGAAQENVLNNVTGDLVVYAAFAVTNKYLLSFYNGDVLLGSIRVRDGEDGAYTGSTPTKDQTAQYVYTFSGWSLTNGGAADPDALTNVTEPRTVYAAFTATLREYDLKFYNGSTLLSTVSVPYGTNGSYTGSTPTKSQTAQYTYSFSGWALTDGGSANANALKNVTADRNVYAAFTATVRTYTVTFVNNTSGSNVTLQTKTGVAYGSSAAYTGATPVSAVDASLAFLGWEPTPTNITGNTTCYAQFESLFEDVEITDSWDTIIANIESGAYKTAYKVGNYKPLDLGTEGTINMQIAAIDTDDLAGGGKAPTTWIAKELLATNHRMNPSRAGSSGNYTNGTGAIGGWENSEMRSYLKTTIKPLIPATVRNAIVEVSKQQPSYNTAGTSETQSTTDDVWLPSYNELFGSSSAAGQPRYKVLFPDNASRVKSKPGASASAWWLRSPLSNINFYGVDSSGSYYYTRADFSYGVALGFCT